MPKRLFQILLFLTLFYPCLTVSAGTSRQKTGITPLQKAPVIGAIQKSAIDGCGCALRLPSDEQKESKRFLFLSDFSGAAQMNLDGKDLKIKLVKETKPKGKPSIGRVHSETYTGGQYTIRIDWRIKKLCDPKDEGCEVTYYSAVITVSRGGQSQKVKALGLCGC
jgi:hypothetical protein